MLHLESLFFLVVLHSCLQRLKRVPVVLVQIHPEIFVDSSGYEDAIQEADRIEQLKRNQSIVESCLILMDVFCWSSNPKIRFRKSSCWTKKIPYRFWFEYDRKIFREKWWKENVTDWNTNGQWEARDASFSWGANSPRTFVYILSMLFFFSLALRAAAPVWQAGEKETEMRT